MGLLMKTVYALSIFKVIQEEANRLVLDTLGMSSEQLWLWLRYNKKEKEFERFIVAVLYEKILLYFPVKKREKFYVYLRMDASEYFFSRQIQLRLCKMGKKPNESHSTSLDKYSFSDNLLSHRISNEWKYRENISELYKTY